MSENIRTRHQDLKEMAKKTRADLESKVEVSSSSSYDSMSEDQKKSVWYLEKLLNVLNIQEKLLDNRMGSTFHHSSKSYESNFDEITRELDKLDDLIQEIIRKTSSSSYVSQ